MTQVLCDQGLRQPLLQTDRVVQSRVAALLKLGTDNRRLLSGDLLRQGRGTQESLRKVKGHFTFLNHGTPGTERLMKPFIPKDLPPADLDWSALIPLIGRSNRALASYAALLDTLHNPALLLGPMTTQEAVLSSRIEGTQATLDEVLKYEAGETPTQASRTADIQEVLNYRKALRAGEAELPKRSFSLSMLKGLHQLLLAGVRGDDKTPGQFRTKQNWIGRDGTTIEQAAFVPPSPETVVGHLEKWEKYYHRDEMDPLVQLALVHAQFEIIHPFIDGNGRLGRILVPLFLFEKRLLKRPMFYLSGSLEKQRDEYYERLRALGQEAGAWNAWCAFFLRSIETQAEQNSETVRRIVELYARLKERVIDLTHSQYAVPLLDQAFKQPVFASLHLRFGPRAPSKQAIAHLLRALLKGGVLRVVRSGSGRRPGIYALAELVNLCEGKPVIK